MKFWELFKTNRDLSVRRGKLAKKYVKLREKQQYVKLREKEVLELKQIESELDEIDRLAKKRLSL